MNETRNKMKKKIAFVLFATICAAVTEGVLVRAGEAFRCQCLKTVSQFINPKRLVDIDIINSGVHCKRVEVIVTLKSGHKVCVDPEAKWVKMIIERLLNK
ncbi:IL8 protein, partial [Atractosteus spatula]|nr:IL8 protein [Atractosteus spatula]